MAGDIYHVYCDESSTNCHAYMALGGIAVAAPLRDTLSTSMDRWRARRGLATQEIKWSKTGNGNVERYKEIASAAMRRIAAREMAFRSAVFREGDIDYNAHHDGDAELGHNRFLFDLLFYCLCPLAPRDSRFLIFPDKRNTSRSLETLRRVLNHSLATRLNFQHPEAVRSIEPRCSKVENFLQVNDILLGAVGYHCNDRHLRIDAKRPRKELAHHIATLADLPDLKRNTPKHMTHFGVWMHALKKLEHPSP